jgi:hypothetical protein
MQSLWMLRQDLSNRKQLVYTVFRLCQTLLLDLAAYIHILSQS